MAYKYFDIELSNVRIQSDSTSQSANPFSLRSWNIPKNSKFYVKFDLDGFASIETVPTGLPAIWRGSIRRLLYNTSWDSHFDKKGLIIQCKQFLPGWKDKVIAEGYIDLHTIATGPKTFELTLFHPEQRCQVCIISFELRFTQIIQDLEIQLYNIDLTDVYHMLTPLLMQSESDRASLANDSFLKTITKESEKAKENKKSKGRVFVACWYFDSIHKAFQLKQFPLLLSSLDKKTMSVIVPEMRIYVGQKTSVPIFQSGAVHIVFLLCLDKSKKKSEELGRIVLPVLGTYSVENQQVDVNTRVLWNESMMMKHKLWIESKQIPTEVPFVLKIVNGPSFSQMPIGRCDSSIIEGETVLGFPLPHSKDRRVKLKTTIYIPYLELAYSKKQLELRGYKIPDWFGKSRQQCQQQNGQQIDFYNEDVKSNEALSGVSFISAKNVIYLESTKTKFTLLTSKPNSNENTLITTTTGGNTGDTEKIISEKVEERKDLLKRIANLLHVSVSGTKTTTVYQKKLLEHLFDQLKWLS